MSEVIKVFAAYGPSQALSLALWPDGSFLFHLQGNVPPLFAAVEMGSWRGVDGARGPRSSRISPAPSRARCRTPPRGPTARTWM
ncbi:MAG: hypothetical protein IPF99_05990 [Deltaproteobacteria bacterium]|nr:hypothetical protein [Deltaproteobacteria bacterium]